MAKGIIALPEDKKQGIQNSYYTKKPQQVNNQAVVTPVATPNPTSIVSAFDTVVVPPVQNKPTNAEVLSAEIGNTNTNSSVPIVDLPKMPETVMPIPSLNTNNNASDVSVLNNSFPISEPIIEPKIPDLKNEEKNSIDTSELKFSLTKLYEDIAEVTTMVDNLMISIEKSKRIQSEEKSVTPSASELVEESTNIFAEPSQSFSKVA